MTREINSGLSAEGESEAYPFNADNQAKPDWHSKWIYREIRDENGFLWKEAYRVERKLDDWIKPFFENCCRMEKIER